MRYQLKIYYQTQHTKKVSECMGRILGDWGNHGNQLEICRTFQFTTDEPLSLEIKDRLLALKKDWMDKLELKEIPEKEKR